MHFKALIVNTLTFNQQQPLLPPPQHPEFVSSPQPHSALPFFDPSMAAAQPGPVSTFIAP
jgi:hypothetical protein